MLEPCEMVLASSHPVLLVVPCTQAKAVAKRLRAAHLVMSVTTRVAALEGAAAFFAGLESDGTFAWHAP